MVFAQSRSASHSSTCWAFTCAMRSLLRSTYSWTSCHSFVTVRYCSTGSDALVEPAAP